MTKTKLCTAIIAIIGILALVYVLSQKNSGGAPTATEKTYVAVEGTGEIAVIDTKTNQILKKIDLSDNSHGMKVGYMPHNVQVAPDNRSVWVTANADNEDMKMSFRLIPRAQADEGHGEEMATGGSSDEVIVIDPFSDVIVKRIELGQDLHLSHVALTPDSAYAIVASQKNGIVYKVNTSSFEVEKEVTTKKGGEPHGLRISPDGTTAYIAMLGGKSLGILDIESFELRDLPLKGAAVQTGVTPNGKYALASVYDAKSLAVYDTTSAKLSYIDLPQESKGPVQLYPTPDSRFVFVADQGYYFDQPVGDTVYKIDLQEMKIAQAIRGGSAPHGVVVSKDGTFTYITNLKSDDVSVIDAIQGKEVAKINVGTMPNGISLWYGEGVDRGTPFSGNTNTSELVSSEKTFDFGIVSMAKGTVSHSFTLKNTGNTPIKVTNISTSCMCTEAILVNGASRKGPFGMPGHGGLSKVNETIDPQQEVTVEVFVDPAAHGPQGTGPAKKVVVIETNSSVIPTLKLELDINVVK